MSLEVLTNINQADSIDGEWRGRIYAFNHDATSLPWSPLRPREFASFNTVALDDLDRDGSIELVTVSGDLATGETWLTVWNVPGVPYVEERFPWPMYGRDRWHTSQYGFKLPDEPTVNVSDDYEHNSIPTEFILHQNYPNPFSSTTFSGGKIGTWIRYELPAPAEVRLRIFNLLGEEVRFLFFGKKTVGQHEIYWEGRNQQSRALTPGVYFYRLEITPLSHAAKLVTRTQKLVLMD